MLKEKTKQEVAEYLCGYLHDKKIKRMKAYVQHGDISTYDHCLLVAYYSFILARKLHLKCSERELIRGALLHDYYLYDWHEKEKWHRWHGFRHANFALKNAMREFRAFSKRNRDHSKAYVAIDDYPANVQGGMDREWGGYFHIFD